MSHKNIVKILSIVVLLEYYVDSFRLRTGVHEKSERQKYRLTCGNGSGRKEGKHGDGVNRGKEHIFKHICIEEFHSCLREISKIVLHGTIIINRFSSAID